MLYKNYLKRLFDIIFSSLAIIMLFPVFIIIFVIIFFEFKGTVFFRQERAGIYGKNFKMIKFRTMIENFDEKGLTEDKAISKFGFFLRKTSLDEIPEFLNVLNGNMSLIGPRPLLVQYVKRYNKNHLKRLNVKPGITGLAQISGRNTLSWSDKFDIDVEYVNNVSLLNDIKIIFLTIKIIFNTNDIDSAGGHMKEFKGYSDEN